MTSEQLDDQDSQVDPPASAGAEPKDAVLVWNGMVASVRVRTADDVDVDRPVTVDNSPKT